MIAENLQQIKSKLPKDVELVAISKTKPNSAILAAYDAGQRVFGENRAQELTKKQEELPKDIEWHMVGHLQRNKVKYIAPFVSLIHSVHSFKLLKEINKQAKKFDRTIDVLIQFHIADEETKSGFDIEEAKEMLDSEHFPNYSNVNICGVMGMATFTDDQDQIQQEFHTLNKHFQEIKTQYFKDDNTFSILSMGMSGDYEIAIEEGSNMVRVGSKIFGERDYS